MGGRPWSKKDVQFLLDNWGRTSAKVISATLGRSVYACKAKAHMLEATKACERRVWSKAEDFFLKTNYAVMTAKELAQQVQHPHGSVVARAHALGLKNTKKRGVRPQNKETPMASRKTIYLTDAAEKVLGREIDSLSGRINSIVSRYGAITAEECPELSEAEWSLLCDILNGFWSISDSRPEIDPAKFLWAEVSDSEPDGAGEKWGVDIPAFAKRLREMRFAESVAILEVAGRFWKSPNLNQLPTRDLLLEAGAKFKK